MNAHLGISIALAVTLVGGSAGAAEPPPIPKVHVTQKMEGWTVHVDERLLTGPDIAVGKRALQLLTIRLVDIALILPPQRVARLQQVPIWLDLTHGGLKPAQYHPSAGWLKANGYDEKLARCVHIPDAAEFAGRGHQHQQPWSVLHELAHAYHDQVLGFEHADIVAAYQRCLDSGRYDKVLHIDGRLTRHYALTNAREFFAEMTESFYGVNDFYPFNRAELRRDEPAVYALLERIWEGK
jgi:hypothetical protein